LRICTPPVCFTWASEEIIMKYDTGVFLVYGDVVDCWIWGLNRPQESRDFARRFNISKSCL